MASPIAAGVIYTCPMHPQIRQAGPGNCPICGMTLEPVKAAADAGENRELSDMTRRFWVGLVLTLPVFVLEMGGHIPALGLHDLVAPRVSTWIQFALSTPARRCRPNLSGISAVSRAPERMKVRTGP
jgi:Cu+-exporting ATPase